MIRFRSPNCHATIPIWLHPDVLNTIMVQHLESSRLSTTPTCRNLPIKTRGSVSGNNVTKESNIFNMYKKIKTDTFLKICNIKVVKILVAKDNLMKLISLINTNLYLNILLFIVYINKSHFIN